MLTLFRLSSHVVLLFICLFINLFIYLFIYLFIRFRLFFCNVELRIIFQFQGFQGLSKYIMKLRQNLFL